MIGLLITAAGLGLILCAMNSLLFRAINRLDELEHKLHRLQVEHAVYVEAFSGWVKHIRQIDERHEALRAGFRTLADIPTEEAG